MVNIDDIRRWYDDKHKQGGTDTWRPLEAYLVFLELLNVKKNKRILDIGCGTGYFLKLADRLGLETSGIDVSNEAVAISRNNSPKSTIKVGQAENLKFTSNMFDYVVCIGALEHFIDMSKSLAEMYRVGDSKAKYCIVVPNKNFIYWKLSFKQGTEQQDINENIFSKTEWESLFKSSGFKIKSTYPDRWHGDKLKIFQQKNVLAMISAIIQKLVWNIIPLNFSYQFIYILTK